MRQPYLVFLGDVSLRSDAKTGFGLRDWCADKVIGQHRLPQATVSLDLPELTPSQAADAGAGSLVIGVAPPGGQLPATWLPALVAALDAGLDVVCGLHVRLEGYPELVAAAERAGRRLINVRRAPERPLIGSGIRRTGQRLLTVGTDCALGKKYTALALAREMTARGMDATFRATGQTGILISGEGVAVDAVLADFIAGTAEHLSPAAGADHWDVIEGQGSLFHPAYAGVSLGLLHGSQPDAIVLCHDPSRHAIEGFPHIAIPPLATAIDRYLESGRLTNPGIRCVGVSINSSSLTEAAWSGYRERLAAELGLPVCDPLRGGVSALVDGLVGAPR